MAVIALASIPPVREAIMGYVRQVVGYFCAEPADASDTVPGTEASVEEDADGSQRASDRDNYDFDLSVLALADEPDTDTRHSS